ncbi:hypothetical protein O0L34_g16371 [Tuta absoluta]|nr:hypothetical protein O0L34_g16371 [Tuta absoluta]
MSAILNSLRNLAGTSKNSTAGESSARFGVAPSEVPGEGGYGEWLHAMRLVARLPAGVPQHFRKKLWLTLSERYLTASGIDWAAAERACFRGTALPDDEQLGAQILKVGSAVPCNDTLRTIPGCNQHRLGGGRAGLLPRHRPAR